MPDEDKRRQEIRPFLSIDDSFRKIIITQDTAGRWYSDEGILTMNIFGFLLDANSLEY